MGQNIKSVKLEFGAAKKKPEAFKLYAFSPMLNAFILPPSGPSGNIKD